MLKPAGGRCNLDCMYCYYIPLVSEEKKKSQDIKNEKGVMPFDILKRAVEETIILNETPQVSFCWHGGEPLLAGLHFFENAVSFQREAAERKANFNKSKPVEIINTIQTNGTLLNEAWCRFFRENNFLVGISIDGPQDIHDKFRLSTNNQSLFNKTLDGIELLKANSTEFNTLTTVNSSSKGRGKEVYNYLKSVGSKFMQFLPVVAPGEPWGIEADDYGEFMIDVFREWWVSRDAGYYYVQLFDVMLANYMGLQGGLCQFNPVCGDIPVIECNGDVYCCDHFVNRKNYLGNITRKSLKDIVMSEHLSAFGIDKQAELPGVCRWCRYKTLCNGGCPEHRILKQSNDYNLNYLCEGYKKLYQYTLPFLKQMAGQISDSIR